ncbi:hypothetical protein J6590_055198 [Homalodisca vitripennis]|nr:hypothetical protein J6590_055198 [Homalodisca vitripennis]
MATYLELGFMLSSLLASVGRGHLRVSLVGVLRSKLAARSLDEPARIGRACLPHLPRHYRSQDQPQLHDQVINGGSVLKIKHADISSRYYHAFRFLYYKYFSSSN